MARGMGTWCIGRLHNPTPGNPDGHCHNLTRHRSGYCRVHSDQAPQEEEET